MSIYDLSTKMAKDVKEMTTSSSIAYLPSGFVPVKKALRTLAKKKKTWGITVLDSQMTESYVVMFEGELGITVPKVYWKQFQQDMLGTIRMEEGFIVNLAQYLAEETAEQISALSEELKQALMNMRVKDRTRDLSINMKEWAESFVSTPHTRGNVLLKYNQYEKDVDDLHKKLLVAYADDRGSLEMIITSIDQRRPLNVFEVFNRYEYLYGGVQNATYEGVELTYQALQTMSWMTEEKVEISDEDVSEEIDGYPGIKVVGDVMYPQGKMFPPKIFGMLKDEIEVIAENAVKEEKERVAKLAALAEEKANDSSIE